MIVSAKSYLSPSDRERINEELRDIKARRNAKSDVKDGDGQYYRAPEFEINDDLLINREKKLLGVLERESPPRLNPIQKNRAFSEFKGLVKEWEDNSLTKYDQGLGYPSVMARMGPDAELAFERAKNKCSAWEFAPRGKFVGARLKQLAGVLDADNPRLRNIENFRRGK